MCKNEQFEGNKPLLKQPHPVRTPAGGGCFLDNKSPDPWQRVGDFGEAMLLYCFQQNTFIWVFGSSIDRTPGDRRSRCNSVPRVPGGESGQGFFVMAVRCGWRHTGKYGKYRG